MRREDPTTEATAASEAPAPDETVVSAATRAPGPAPDEDVPLAPGAKIDRYVVLETVGAGGMGVVYAAYDPELDRKVALKLLRPGTAGTIGATGASARLLREAQAMAKLSHPNVITVHDVGTYQDQVFVAMEYVEGPTLREWLVASDRSYGEVLEIFLRAGAGLAAAHAAGLVHRDFKPDNVLVGRDGRVRVVDFGLARAEGAPPQETPAEHALADTGPGALVAQLTVEGALLGTPAYMAAEQHLRQPADARTDQFSFCVALYEGLYGERPFTGRTAAELAREVTQGRVREPPADTRVPEWLRRILLRGLRVDPAERYPSMAPLLHDLAHDPRAARRRRLQTMGILLLVAGAGVGVWQALEARTRPCLGAERRLTGVWDEDRRQAVLASFRHTGKPFAPDAFTGAAAALDEYAARWAAMRTDACEATRVRGEQSEDLLDLRMQCLDQRLREMRALTDLFTRADAKVAQNAVQAALALSPVEDCADVETLRNQVRPPKDPATRAKVEEVRAQIAQAKALRLAGKYRDGLAVAQSAATAAQALGHRPTEAHAAFVLGNLQAKNGRFQLEERSLHDTWRAALAGRDDRLAAQVSSRLVSTLGYRLARYDDARHWAEVAKALVERLGGDALLQEALENALGRVAAARGHYDEALANHRRALELLEKARGAPSALAIRLNNIGITLYRIGRFEEALGYLRRALSLGEKALGPGHPTVGMYVNNIGIVLTAMGKYEDALRHHQRVLAIYERAYHPDHTAVADSHNNHGIVYRDLRRFAPSLTHYRRALAIYEKSQGTDHPNTARVLNNLGNALQAAGRHDEAMSHLDRALAIWTRRHGPGHPEVATVLQNQGAVRQAERRFAEAHDLFRRALSIRERALGRTHPNVAESLLTLGEVLLAQRQPAQAVESLERSVRILGETPGAPVVLARARFALARALFEAKRTPQRARHLAEAARDAYARAGSPRRHELAKVNAWLARVAAPGTR
jgi:tetratricopeptide (TPR) repeat protein